MRVVRLDLGSGPLGLGRPVATIGNFDGLHLGHRKIIGEAVRRARASGRPAAVVTFDPHPVKVLHPGASFRCLKTLDQRLRDLEAMGADLVALVRFDAELAGTTARAFVERVLVRALRVGEVLVGRSFRFGHGRAGDFALLEALGREHGFAARAVAAVRRGGRPVSSSRIREALAAGDVREARRLLGRGFEVEGVVVRGTGRGKPLLFPTANLETGNECLPAEGVYATRVLALGRPYAGATFLGAASTFGEHRPVFESHLLGWTGGDLYGERLRVEFVARLRAAERFPSAAALREAIERDLRAVRRRVRLPAASRSRAGWPRTDVKGS